MSTNRETPCIYIYIYTHTYIYVCVCVCQRCTNPRLQNAVASIFLCWQLKSVASFYGTVFLSPFWRLEFWGGLWCWKSCESLIQYNINYMYYVYIHIIHFCIKQKFTLSVQHVVRYSWYQRRRNNNIYILSLLHYSKCRISRPIRRTFFPEKCDLNSTCVLCTEGKYYFQTYKYPYIYYTTSLSWDSEKQPWRLF